MQNKKIEIYTDGSCIGNPGPGGWGAVIFIDGKEIELSGSEEDTTNNRMEMMAIIKALEWINDESGLSSEDAQSHKILIHSDSNLVIQTLNQGWKKKANTDLWADIDRVRAWLDIDWIWVKAHAENEHNNRVDALAFKEAKALSKNL
ncbi:ribonuclease HI [Candidatus Peregrinibacteria bacterium]|jgi:ribonuclease HI|nr:ribonuclease HI [Candidatus Peregrinibacteria bacterium]MBT7736691.1 ribonuclease HI [Candidatus Peregrinibacteria bacterium]